MKASFAKWMQTLKERPELISGRSAERRVMPAVKHQAAQLDEGTLARLEVCRACDQYVKVCREGGRWGRCKKINGCSTRFILQVKAARCPLHRFGVDVDAGGGR